MNPCFAVPRSAYPWRRSNVAAKGVPVVASAVGGIPGVLDHGRAGSLIPPGNVAALATSLLGTRNDSLPVTEKVAVAKELVRTKYSSMRMAEKYFVIYCEVLPECVPSARS